MLKLSIILPVYNVEQYLDRCLQSLLNQDIDISEYEVILVDDKSTDNSVNVIRKWQKKYNNIKIIQHTENKKPGAARNTGLRESKGAYVWFIDSDDYIKENCISDLLETAILSDLSVLVFDFKQQNQKLKWEKTLNSSQKTEIMIGAKYLEHSFEPTTLSVWSKIYKREYLLQQKMYFNENCFWEDADWVIKSIYFAPKLQYIPLNVYRYCMNTTSISNQINWIKSIDMINMGYSKIKFALSIADKSPNLSKKICEDGIWNATVIKKIIFFSRKDRILFYKGLDDNVRKLIGKMVNNRLYRFLFLCPRLSKFSLFFISPVLKQIKNR